MFEVKSVADVIRIINENFSNYPLPTEAVNIKNAVDRVTACDIKADEDIPSFNRSAVDGYAVIAADTFGSGEALPAQLKLVGEVRMGEKPGFTIDNGQAAYIPTGGELPENANAIVMIEYAEDMKDGYVYLYKPVAPGNNVVFRGDDIKAGDPVIKARHRLRSQNIGVLAALGIETVTVQRKLRVGIVVTGDEVVDICQKPAGSQIRDVNSYVLYAGLMEYGAEPILFGIVSDSYQKLKETVERALLECDVVLISGGSSVGARDQTFRVINSLSKSEVLVQGIAVKPGKPTIIGKAGNKAVVGLPGHPVSACFIFTLLVTLLIDVMNGIVRKPAGTVQARITGNYPSNHGREEYIPVIIRETEDGILAQPVFGKSGLIKPLAMADGYVKIERGSEGINQGEAVEVVLF
jgi:molybdopterin molybdotransferase